MLGADMDAMGSSAGCCYARQLAARSVVAVIALLLLNVVAVAGDAPQTRALEAGATVTVRANTIWFQEPDKLTRWQELKRSGSAELAAYEREELDTRDAWQFTLPLSVEILDHDAARGQLHVEMQTAGRMKGTTWYLDAAAIEP